jgi:hypothetical protein
MHSFSYGAVVKGGTLNVSGADFSPLLVIYKEEHRRHPWTNGLEWLPQRVQVRDFSFFDYAIIAGDVELQAFTEYQAFLQPVTDNKRWRLYKILPVW